MKSNLLSKYVQYTPVNLSNREWPSKVIEKAPLWCSVDLRDGNQALVTPMNVEEKVEMFQLLVELGFKQIEVGFPSASETEYSFLRKIIEENLIPEDVTVQVLTQSREHLIHKSIEALSGAKQAIVHLYNATSTLQRDVVFQKSKEEIKEIALTGVQWIKEKMKEVSTHITLEYSPESFTGTELEYALEVCEAVIDAWDSKEKVIINLPATVEMSTPNVYADRIEWFCKNLKDRSRVIISLHTHNDRGTAVAASELGIMAGADRVEGTLFGNGERTGNADIVNLALNMYSQGIDPKLDLHDLNRIVKVYEKCNKMVLPPRHPYAGELVYTAFSGSHQDAINKGFKKYYEGDQRLWAVPYLPIDPQDFGRTYEAVIRINSQSGKGGVAYIMEQQFGYNLPKKMHPEFSSVVQKVTDTTGKEIQAQEMLGLFEKEYLHLDSPLKFVEYSISSSAHSKEHCNLKLKFIHNGKEIERQSMGVGPLDACKNILKEYISGIDIVSYEEHSIDRGSQSEAISYIEVYYRGKVTWGVGKSQDVTEASILSLFSATNRII